MEGGGLTNDTCQSHKATAGSHNALSFSRAEFIEQFKEHLKQRNELGAFYKFKGSKNKRRW